MGLFQKWQVLSITYWDNDRTREMSRHLYGWKYWRYKTAYREARRLEDQATLENRFNREYLVVKAP